MFESYPRIHHLHREQLVPRPLDEVFGFFARAGNLERITPPWLGFSLQDPEPAEMHAGTLIEYRLHLHRLPLRWISRIEVWEPDPDSAYVHRYVPELRDGSDGYVKPIVDHRSARREALDRYRLAL